MAVTTHPKENTMDEETPHRTGPDTAKTPMKNTTDTTTAKSANDSDGQEKEEADVTYLMVWATLSLLIIINPALIGFNLLFFALVSTCIALQLLLRKSKTKDTKGLTHFQFVTRISFYSKELPLLIGITALICILSTTAPIVQALYGAIQLTLNSNSIIALQSAIYYYLAYQVLYWIGRNVYTKVNSQNLSAQGGYDSINKFGKKINDNRKGKSDKEKEEINSNYENVHKNMRNADDITTKFWYFIQTISSAAISMTSSIISVLNFELPAALEIAKANLTKRFFAIAVLLNLLSYWFSQVFVQDITTKMQNAKNDIHDNLKEDNENPADKYGNFQNDLNWRSAIQDGFYGLPRAMCSDNTIAILIIILTISPSFPLATSVITAHQVLTLASSLCRMMTDSLVISRNIGEWTRSAAGFNAINKGPDDKNVNRKPAFENISEIKKLFEDDPYDKRDWTEDLSDSFACILTIIFATELACTLNGIAFVGVSAIGLMPIFSALLGLTFYWTYQVSNTLKSKAKSSPTAKQKAKARFGNLFCNTMATALFMRMLSMFSPYIPAIVKSVMAFGLTTTFWPQIVISGIACHLFMTLLITPMLLPEDAYSSPIKTHTQKLVENLQKSAKTSTEYFSNVMSKLQDFIKSFNKNFSVNGNKSVPENTGKFKTDSKASKENNNGQGLLGSLFSMFSTSGHSNPTARTDYRN